MPTPNNQNNSDLYRSVNFRIVDKDTIVCNVCGHERDVNCKHEETEVILTGFHRGKYIALEEHKKRIKQHFDPNYGLRASTDSGTITVFYNGSFPIQTGEADLKRIQINLLIKEWKQKGDM